MPARARQLRKFDGLPLEPLAPRLSNPRQSETSGTSIGEAISWLGAVVLLLILAAGTALTVVALVGEAGPVEIALLALLTAALALRWARRSFALDKLRG